MFSINFCIRRVLLQENRGKKIFFWRPPVPPSAASSFRRGRFVKVVGSLELREITVYNFLSFLTLLVNFSIKSYTVTSKTEIKKYMYQISMQNRLIAGK